MKVPLLKSRRFWTTVLDSVLAIATVIVAYEADEATQKLLLSIFAALQPVFLVLIAAFTVDDVVEIQSRARATKQ